MNKKGLTRRSFLSMLGIGSAVVAIAPGLPETKPELPPALFESSGVGSDPTATAGSGAISVMQYASGGQVYYIPLYDR